MRAVIVEDEPLARALLRRLLAAHADVELVGEAGDGDAAIRAIAAHRPDVVFLDVELPGRDGFDVLAGLADPPAIVFVTAHDRYAVRAFEVAAVDYLHKPFDDERLARALDRLRARLAAGDPDALRRDVAALAALVRRARGRLAVRDGETTLLVPFDDIEHVEASGKHVVIHVVTGAGVVAHTVRDTLAALAQRLDPERFVRVHRSAIVNLDHVRELRPWFAGDQHLTLTSGRTLTTGRGFRDRLRARLGR